MEKVTTVQINGLNYKVREQEYSPVTKKLNSKLAQLFIMANALNSMSFPGSKSSSGEISGYTIYDIIREYELIQQKIVSYLKKQREWYEYQFNKNFTKIE